QAEDQTPENDSRPKDPGLSCVHCRFSFEIGRHVISNITLSPTPNPLPNNLERGLLPTGSGQGCRGRNIQNPPGRRPGWGDPRTDGPRRSTWPVGRPSHRSSGPRKGGPSRPGRGGDRRVPGGGRPSTLVLLPNPQRDQTDHPR